MQLMTVLFYTNQGLAVTEGALAIAFILTGLIMYVVGFWTCKNWDKLTEE